MMKRLLPFLLVCVMLLATPASIAFAADEPEVVTWIVPGDRPEDLEIVLDDLNAKLKEKINVELDLKFYGWGEYEEKARLMTTSGGQDEIVWTSSWYNSFEANLSRDAFLPLDDLLAEYGQGITDNCPSWVIDFGRSNGTLYAIPCLQVMYSQSAVYLDEALAKEYGWDKPYVESVEEFYPYFDWVKENHPDRVPTLTAGQYNNMRWEGLSSFLCINKEDPATICSSIEADNEKMTWLRFMFDQGYLRPDIATVDNEEDDRRTGRYASAFASNVPGAEVVIKSQFGQPVIQVPIGTKGYVGCTAGTATMNAINVNADHPEAAMKFLSLLWGDKEIFNELLFGVEGIHYTKTGENSVEQIPGGYETIAGYAWEFGNQFEAWTMPGQADDVWEITAELNNNSEVSDNLGFTIDYSDYQTELAQLSAVSAEYSNGFYTCEDLDAYLAERAAKLEAAGLQTLVDGVQAQLDAFRAANGK